MPISPFNYKVQGTKSFNKSIEVPTSKSRANRYLVLAALCTDEVVIENLPSSTDVLSMIKSLSAVCLDIEHVGSTVTIRNSFPSCEFLTDDLIQVNTGDGGTTNRFLIAMLSRGRNEYAIFPAGQIRKRPVKELVQPLISLGAEVMPGKKSDYWMSIGGPIRVGAGEKIAIDCSKSSQFASALYMALHNTDVEIELENLENSIIYFEMTRSIVNEFKKGKRLFKVPIDFSGISYPLALAAHQGEVKVTNYTEIDPYQGDSIFLGILKNAGAEVISKSGELIVRTSGKIRSQSLDCAHYPDLVPTLGYLFAYADGKTEFKNISSLAHKECNRIKEMLKIFELFNVEAKYNDLIDVMTVYGNPNNLTSEQVVYDAPDDHRMVMVAYLFMRHNTGGEILNAHHVAKSFPNFFETMK